MKSAIGCLLFLLLLPAVSAATLHGIVYDFDLQKVHGAIVEISSIPSQRTIAVNGSYSFELYPGTYTLSAYQKDGNYTLASANDQVTILQDGSYVLDILLFPSLDDEIIGEIGSVDVEEPDFNSRISAFQFIIYSMLVLASFALLLFAINKFSILKKGANTEIEARKGEEEIELMQNKQDEKKNQVVSITDQGNTTLDSILSILRKEGGRMTQKELRKHIPFSEAKASLMLTELEDKGLIKRIKQGRGNIIILQEK